MKPPSTEFSSATDHQGVAADFIFIAVERQFATEEHLVVGEGVTDNEPALR